MAAASVDHLRVLLDHLDGEARADQLEFFRALMEAGPDGVPELGTRLPGIRAPRALRQLSLEAAFYFPWPEWVPILSRILRYEPELAIFQSGVRALGRIGGLPALEALRELMVMRQGTEFKELIAAVLSETDPAEAFNHHLARLMEGSAHPGTANEAAQRLAQVLDAGSLEPLKALTMHPDLLVFRHALALLAKVPAPEAAEALLEILQDTTREILADRALKEALGGLRPDSPGAARAASQEALEHPDPRDFQGAVKSFHRQVVIATAAEAKAGQLALVLTQAMDGLQLRARRLAYAVDAAAEGLAAMVARGLLDGDRVLPPLVETFRERAGREGVARALGRLVPSGSGEIHRLILEAPDGAQRAAALEVLGERREEALMDLLIQACRDPIADIADRALHHLGRLEGAEALARRLLGAPGSEEATLGLRLVGQARLVNLVPDVLEFMKASTREDRILMGIQALGATGAAESAPALLDMLHSGQSARLQVALAQALRDLGDPGTARALCAKADELRMEELHILAVEALAAAHPLSGVPLPPDGAPLLLDQVQQVWSGRNPWSQRLALVTALQGIRMEHPGTWRALGAMVQEALGDKRASTFWNPKELQQVQAAAREMALRG